MQWAITENNLIKLIHYVEIKKNRNGIASLIRVRSLIRHSYITMTNLQDGATPNNEPLTIESSV